MHAAGADHTEQRIPPEIGDRNVQRHCSPMFPDKLSVASLVLHDAIKARECCTMPSHRAGCTELKTLTVLHQIRGAEVAALLAVEERCTHMAPQLVGRRTCP